MNEGGEVVLPSSLAKQDYVQSMFDRIAPSYELVNRVMTFGLDARWRARLVDAVGTAEVGRALDLGCGTGDLLRVWRARGIGATGLDLSMGMLSLADCEKQRVQAAGEALPFLGSSFDAVTSGFAVRNFSDLREVFTEVARVLKPGGRFGVLEVSAPRNRVLRFGHRLYFSKVVPLIGGLISKDRGAYQYLPKSVVYLPNPQEWGRLLVDCGFLPPTRIRVGLGAAQIVIAERRAA